MLGIEGRRTYVLGSLLKSPLEPSALEPEKEGGTIGGEVCRCLMAAEDIHPETQVDETGG